eukprot:PhF_6_TR12567/c0_g1_i1/m.19706
MTSIQVAVRVRPFNSRELKFESRNVIIMDDAGTLEIKIVRQGKVMENEQPRKFNFDYCFWTHDQTTMTYASQTMVYEKLGTKILENSLQGYNSCLFAYGQTGSGKTYSMMGIPSDSGIIPRLCKALYLEIEKMKESHTFTVECEYLEIYNENVRDLLNPSSSVNSEPLKVRQHPKLGVFVEGLTKIMVHSEAEIMKLIDEGAHVRTVAATNMNANSSRSHAILTLKILQRSKDGEKMSNLNLVDLAGSERANSTGATGQTLTEGANINKSLTTLGMCLSRLADIADGKSKVHIPYRDSQLTWLLNDSLGGNSKTAMLANISPADVNFDETLSTLRFAATTKRIKNNAIINEDPMQKIIRELRLEIDSLKEQLKLYESGEAPPAQPHEDIIEQLREDQQLLAEAIQSPEERTIRNAELQKTRQSQMKALMGVMVNRTMPHVVTLNQDLHRYAGVGILYYIREGDNPVGSEPASDLLITLPAAARVKPRHCTFRFNALENTITLIPLQGTVTVNGFPIEISTVLKHKDHIIIEKFVFRFSYPASTVEHLVSFNRDSMSVASELRLGHLEALEDITRMEIMVESQDIFTEISEQYQDELQDCPLASTVCQTDAIVFLSDMRKYGTHLKARLDMTVEDAAMDFPATQAFASSPTSASGAGSPRGPGAMTNAEFEYAVWERQQVLAIEAEKAAKQRKKEEDEALIASLKAQIKERRLQQEQATMESMSRPNASNAVQRAAEKEQLRRALELEEAWEKEKIKCTEWQPEGPVNPEDRKSWLNVFSPVAVPTFGQVVEADVDFQGPIMKLGPRKFIFGGWKSRWGVIRKRFLFYFENNKTTDQKCIGAVYLYGAKVERLPAKYHDREFCIKIHPCVPRNPQKLGAREEDHNFVFSAESSDVADVWVSFITKNSIPEPPDHVKRRRGITNVVL